jgi:hypothetical protein
MSRLGRAFGVVVALLVVGLVVSVAGAPGAGIVLLLASALLLGVLAFFSQAQARRSPGWTRAYNPGAAYREAKEEQEAILHPDPDVAPSESDKPGV